MTNDLYAYVLINLKRFINLDKQFSLEEFLKQKLKIQKTKKASVLNKTIEEYEKKLDELDKIFKILYSDRVSDKITPEQFNRLYKSYSDDEENFKNKISEIKKQVKERKQETTNIQDFTNALRKCQNEILFNKLTEKTLHKLIDKIFVHEGIGKRENRTQSIDIYWKNIGLIDFSDNGINK